MTKQSFTVSASQHTSYEVFVSIEDNDLKVIKRVQKEVKLDYDMYSGGKRVYENAFWENNKVLPIIEKYLTLGKEILHKAGAETEPTVFIIGKRTLKLVAQGRVRHMTRVIETDD